MKIQILISAVAMLALAPFAKADTYTETEVSQTLPLETTREVRTTTQSSPSVVTEQPIVVPPPTVVTPPANNETVIVKKHSHHLLNLGVVKVF